MIEFKNNGDIIEMWVEREVGPFDEYIIATIKKGEDGYFRLHPVDGAIMICRYLRTAAEKLSELN